MDFARASWLVIIVACLATAVVLVLSGYVGYSLTATAVALAAAVNLIPRP